MAFDLYKLKKQGLRYNPSKKLGLTILIDERQDRLDNGLTRTIISCVEIDEELTIEDLQEAVKAVVNKSKLSVKKLHFAEFNQPEKLILVGSLSEISFSAKVWIFYDTFINSSVAKKNSLRYVIRALKKKHSRREVSLLVEHADEYDKLVREQFMTSNAYLSLLPDLTCYIMALKLDLPNILAKIENNNIRTRRQAESSKMISQMHEHIRLQVFTAKLFHKELIRHHRL